jgi:hypothetical protein
VGTRTRAVALKVSLKGTSQVSSFPLFSAALAPPFFQCEDFASKRQLQTQTWSFPIDDKYFPITTSAISGGANSHSSYLPSFKFCCKVRIIFRVFFCLFSSMFSFCRLLPKLLPTNHCNLQLRFFTYLPNTASSSRVKVSVPSVVKDTTTRHMSLLQHTGPSTFYTELAELPLPVSADFVAGDGAYQLNQPL